MRYFLNKILSFLFGYQIKSDRWSYSSDKNLIKSIKANKIKTIIDIGANEGQFAMRMINLGFKGSIMSFEPMKIQYENLIENIKKNKIKSVNWLAEKRCALGSKNEKKKIYISGKNQSSSLMKLSKKYLNISPESAVVNQEEVEIEVLDNFKEKISHYNKQYLLKIDVQGFELEVLRGSNQILDIVDCIFIEVSHVNLYQDQVLSVDIINFLIEKKFKIWSIDSVFINKNSGQHYQSDIFLVKQ